MKKCVWVAWLLLSSFQLYAAVLRWDGQGNDGLWSTPGNWDLDRLPETGDEVILDNTFLFSGYNVTLPSGSTAISLISLRITPADHFSIYCIIPVTNTAIPGLILTGTGDVLILDRGAVLRNASGASAGTPLSVTANGFFRINNGGHYIHQTARGHTDFLVSRLSDLPGTEEGVFEFDVPGTASYTVSISGRTFGRLVFSAASAGAGRTYTGAGINPLLIRGGLTIRENTVLSYGANVDTITVNGQCSIAAGAIFNIANGSNRATVLLKGDLDNRGFITETGSSSGSVIVMNGSVAQTISGGGSIIQEVKMMVDNPAGITLLGLLHLPYQLEFISGKIRSSASNLLSFGPGAVCSGANDHSFVEGPVKKTGRSAFVFPVGVGAIYAPVFFEEGGDDADEFIVSYRRANPQSLPGLGSSCLSPINHVSYVEFWELIQAAGSSSRRISFSVSPFSFVHDLDAIVVSRFENGSWVSEGGVDHTPGPPSPPYMTGTLSSVSEVSQFGAFTLGSTVNQQLNPLPLFIERFESQYINGRVHLLWKAGDCNGAGFKYVLQHALPGEHFKLLASLPGNNNSCTYDFIHHFPPSGQNHYQLNVLNGSGDTVYQTNLSERITNTGRDDTHSVRVIKKQPDGIDLITDLPLGDIQILIVGQNGAIVASHTIRTSRRGEVVFIKTPFLSNGIYRVIAVGGNKKVSGFFIR
ncbi:hypothetical protein LZZ85_15040 [Terrimonas sp. NA20]|uniref:T9SS type A sorting domain-containing protein n=1 Tax=Terrimonas ginsenosidimutans TaxID=2908004 RepID=A0ABS9KTJ0_9BACT|nr:hypothetical protein [Terrimonas ginsenosidimutans]MCG2615615.1 hypothetical protein [Terrimonas ginsenosidimutans]